MEQSVSDKNKLNKDTTNEDINLKFRIFNFFFYVLKKRDLSIFLCALFIILETIQLISYAFSEPVN